MKILIATGIYPPDIGGPATYSKLLFDALPKRGIDVLVESFGAVRSYPRGLRHLLYFARLMKSARLCDVVYAQDPVSVGLPALLASCLLRKKFILKVVGDYAWEQGTQRFHVTDRLDEFASKVSGYRFPVWCLKMVQKWVALRADQIIVPSTYLKKIVRAWGISESKIEVIYNSFDMSEHTFRSRDIVRHELGVGERPLVISVGRLVPWKGFELLVVLWKEVLKDISDAMLCIVGDGPDREKLEALIRTEGLQSSVHLLGRVSHEKVLDYVHVADVFVLNTDYEGFSHQLLEVMVCRTPIITTPVGGNIEIVADGVNGVLVPFNDSAVISSAIIHLLENKDRRDMLVEGGLVTARSFSSEVMLDRLVNHISVL